MRIGELLGSLVQFTVGHWCEPGNGIWELRSERRHFTDGHVARYDREQVDDGLPGGEGAFAI